MVVTSTDRNEEGLWGMMGRKLLLLLFSYSSCVQLFCDPVGCSPSGSFVHGILQARILGWAAISSSRGSS